MREKREEEEIQFLISEMKLVKPLIELILDLSVYEKGEKQEKIIIKKKMSEKKVDVPKAPNKTERKQKVVH